MVTGTIVVETERNTSFFSEGVGSASDVDSDVGAAVILRGKWVFVGLVHCSLWIHHVSDEGHWRQIWYVTYENATNPVKQRGIPFTRTRMVHVLHWTRFIIIIVCNMLKL